MKPYITPEDLSLINAQLNAGNDVTIKRIGNGCKIIVEFARTIKKKNLPDEKGRAN